MDAKFIFTFTTLLKSLMQVHYTYFTIQEYTHYPAPPPPL